jgi:hypothetical protein
MIRATIIAAGVAVLTCAAPVSAQLPSSWQEFVDFHVQGGDLGTWTGGGKTEAMWEGIPAGLEYTFVEEQTLTDDGRTMQRHHMMRTEDGRVISVGSGITYWDAESGTVKSSYSGYDTGEPFWGTSTLLGLDANGARWEYTETTRGKTTEYLTERRRTGTNERADIVRKAAGGDPWTTTLTRANPMAAVTARFDVAGTWEWELSDGSRRVMTMTPGLDGRTIFSQDRTIRSDGSSEEFAGGAMWWDGGRDTLCFHYLNNTGMSVMGEMISLSYERGVATMVSRHRGTNANGRTIAVTLTRVIDGDTMTTTYSDFSMEGTTSTPAWVDVPTVFRRTARN